jgi:peptidyl-prolyl cis-trans isomerase A (cyclophilin A)
MSRRIGWGTAVFLGAILVCVLPGRTLGQTNGIFADFTTSLGSFTCQLDYTNAPKAVANFIGLATGQRAWLDLPTGRVRTNTFYNGLTFHRVIANFMIQGGSPNGQGNDGPGYVFQDEFHPSLTFSDFGVLAMANSGTNSNGSQFFITVASTPWLNNVHTIFGRVTSGSNVVYAISRVATGANDKPLTNVVIQQVAIRRVGSAAQAFNVHGQGLPTVTNLALRINPAGSDILLSFTNRLHADNRLYVSTNLSGWSGLELGLELGPTFTNSLRRPRTGCEFFRMAQIQYPASTLAPRAVTNRVLTLNFGGGSGTIVITFDATGGGTYTYTAGSPGVITAYDWHQEPYAGRLWPIYYSALVPMTLRLGFASTTGGTFSGTAYGTSAFPVSGSFTLGP